jgi:hypothetical protein
MELLFHVSHSSTTKWGILKRIAGKRFGVISLRKRLEITTSLAMNVSLVIYWRLAGVAVP